jgi:hypothetical protein
LTYSFSVLSPHLAVGTIPKTASKLHVISRTITFFFVPRLHHVAFDILDCFVYLLEAIKNEKMSFYLTRWKWNKEYTDICLLTQKVVCNLRMYLLQYLFSGIANSFFMLLYMYLKK